MNNKEKWVKIREKGKSAYILKRVYVLIATLATAVLIHRIVMGHWISVNNLYFYGILVILSPAFGSFVWNRYEKKYPKE